MKTRIFDFNKTLSKANKIESTDERILFLKKEIKEYRQTRDNWALNLDNFEDKVNDEITYLSELKKSNKNDIQIKPIKHIWWKKSNRLLGYLIEKLMKLGYIDRETDINRVIKDHFIDKDKKPFTDSIKQNRSGAGINKESKPKGSNDIDNIISNIKE
jgi:hypothetical protein